MHGEMVAVGTVDGRLSLFCRAGTALCAFPLGCVVETTRPLPVEVLPNAPAFVAGVAIVRGAPLPIVVVGRLLGHEEGHVDRFVVVRAGHRRVGLAVDEVIGVRALSGQMLAGLPPLIAQGSRAIAEIGALDGELMLVLDAARMVPADVFAMLDAERLAS